MKDNFLIIHFGDNDFGTTLKFLGEHILSEKFGGIKSSKDVIRQIESTGDLGNILTSIFRGMLCINQHRFDLHGTFNYDYDMIRKKNDSYMNSDYYELNPYFSEYYEHDLNSECLVIDFKNNTSFVV